METALSACTVIEDYSRIHRTLPDCLVLGLLPDGRPLHAVMAVDEANDRVLVVTVYVPDPVRWKDDWRTRR